MEAKGKVAIRKAFNEAKTEEKTCYSFDTYWLAIQCANKCETARKKTVESMLAELGIDHWYCDLSLTEQRDKIYFYCETIVCDVENHIHKETGKTIAY